MKVNIPRWKQLPEIALYMDQVLLVLGGIFEPLATEETPMVTATMINNYVKMKLTPPPEKKKYAREHLAMFLMICLLKKVMSMTEIAALREQLLAVDPLETVYDRFCQEMELRSDALDGPDSPECPLVMAAAVRSVAAKIQVEQLLKLQSEQEKEKSEK